MKNEGLRTLFFTLFSPTGSVIGFLFCLAFAEFLRYNKTTEKEMLSVLTKNTEKLSNQELREMMGKVAAYYQDLHKETVTRIKTFIEPILTIFLTVVVGIIILAVIIPMFSLYGSIQNYG